MVNKRARIEKIISWMIDNIIMNKFIGKKRLIEAKIEIFGRVSVKDIEDKVLYEMKRKLLQNKDLYTLVSIGASAEFR